MTLYELISILKSIALTQPSVRSTGDGNIYEVLNTKKDNEYSVFFITQGTHREDEEVDHYTLTLFYVDRLLQDMEDNRLQIQSVGKSVLSNIITTLCHNYDIDYTTITYTPFTQRFSDECAGMYAQITFDIMKDFYCPEEY